MGVHLEQNRRPEIIIDATSVLHEIDQTTKLNSANYPVDSLFPVLGYLCGVMSDGVVPLLLGLESWNVTKDQLKAFCAAFGTTGTSPLVHIAGITPEAIESAVIADFVTNAQRPLQTITMDDLLDTYEIMDSSNESEKVDLVALGNPHLSISECETLAEMVHGLEKDDSVRILACMSRTLYSDSKDYTDILEEFGVEFIHDTCWCMLLDPPVIPASVNGTIITNSGKYAHYGPGLTQRKYRFGSLQDCVNVSVTGRYQSNHRPKWLTRSGRRMFSTLAKKFF